MRPSRLAVLLAIGVALSASAQYSEWSVPTNLGPPVNTTGPEFGPFLSKNGLTLFFGRGFPDIDIWVSQRPSTDDPWGAPARLGSNVNSVAPDNNACLSLDEHELYFVSTRSEGMGGTDIYVARRHDKRDPLGWEAAVNLGSIVNSPAGENHPTFFEDEETGTITMYFDSNRPGLGGADIYQTTLLPDGTFTVPVLVTELSTSSNDQHPSVSRNGLEIFLSSDRSGTAGTFDLMVATRENTSEPWSEPVFLGSSVNTPQREATPFLSFNRTALYFQSTAVRPDAVGPCTLPTVCVFDIYVTTRTKMKRK